MWIKKIFLKGGGVYGYGVILFFGFLGGDGEVGFKVNFLEIMNVNLIN